MSADNWAVCPRCLAGEQERIRALRQQADEAYGVLPVDEFDALRVEADKPIDLDALSTFREDYEFYGAEDGVISVRYSGACQKCGLAITIKEERPFWPEPAS